MSFNDSSPDGSWFRIGRLEVGSVVAVVIVAAASMLVSVIVTSLPMMLLYAPALVGAGQVWRLVTWPLADSVGLWSVLNLFFFAYFGSDLERVHGRAAMAKLLVGCWAVLTFTYTVVAVIGGGGVLAGLGMVEFLVLLLWIAEYPTRRFLFNIPAWAFGAFLLGLNVLTTIAARNWAALLALALSLVFVAMVARRVGLLADYSWIPGRRSARPVGRTHARSSAPTPRSTRRAASDEDRMDELLGKISANGLHSLSKSERKELDKLRLRRKQGR